MAKVRLAMAAAANSSPACGSSLNFFLATLLHTGVSTTMAGYLRLSPILCSALVRMSWLRSTRATFCWAAAATWAMPVPMRPPPITTTSLTALVAIPLEQEVVGLGTHLLAIAENIALVWRCGGAGVEM